MMLKIINQLKMNNYALQIFTFSSREYPINQYVGHQIEKTFLSSFASRIIQWDDTITLFLLASF